MDTEDDNAYGRTGMDEGEGDKKTSNRMWMWMYTLLPLVLTASDNNAMPASGPSRPSAGCGVVYHTRKGEECDSDKPESESANGI